MNLLDLVLCLISFWTGSLLTVAVLMMCAVAKKSDQQAQEFFDQYTPLTFVKDEIPHHKEKIDVVETR